MKNKEYYFRESLTWSDISGSNFAVRANAQGFLFDVKGSSAFVDKIIYYYILGFMNTKVVLLFCNMLNPSVTTQVGDIKQIPLVIYKEKMDVINALSKENVEISKTDWDSFETSWDFKKHPLI